MLIFGIHGMIGFIFFSLGDLRPTTQLGRLVFGSSSQELAETTKVSGGTHTSCGEVLTWVDLIFDPNTVIFENRG